MPNSDRDVLADGVFEGRDPQDDAPVLLLSVQVGKVAIPPISFKHTYNHHNPYPLSMFSSSTSRGGRSSGRATYGRGSFGGYGTRGRAASIPTTPSPPLGKLIQSFSLDQLPSISEPKLADSHLTDCELMASYSWMDKASPSITIPGMPPRWSPLLVPRELAQDSGTVYRDGNASRFPDHPLEPAIQAVLEMAPKEAVADVDIVGCGSTLGSLLRFVRGEPRSFRMLVEVIGTTVHLIRRENSPREIIPDVRGYGHSFPEAYTSWDAGVRGSASNQRIVRYRFGGMSFLVRFESDGYLPDKAGSTKPAPKSPKKAEEDSLESLTSTLAAAPIAPKTPLSGEALRVSHGGRTVPQPAIFDLKTRSARRMLLPQDVLADELPRLWLAQISNFILAFHDRGTFHDIKIQDVRDDVSRWESDHAAELAHFAALLRRVVHLARSRPNGRLEIHREEGAASFQFREQVPGLPPAFSGETEKRWREHLGPTRPDSEKDPGFFYTPDGGDSDDDDRSYSGRYGYDSDNGESEEKDFTACSADDCGYCGRCMY